MKYDLIRPKLNTGDIVLYSGGGDFSAWIKATTLCKWSHVAFVVRTEKPDIVLVWESCGNGVAFDNFDQQMRPKKLQFVKRLINYSSGDVAVRHLYFDRPVDWMARFEEIRKELEGRPYETDNVELAKAVLGEWGNNEEAITSFFCSELVAETYKRLGLLPAERPSNTYRPKDFSDSGTLPLLDGALGPEILLTEKV